MKTDDAAVFPELRYDNETREKLELREENLKPEMDMTFSGI